MDKTALVNEVANLFRMNGHNVETSVRINHREIDVVAKEMQGLIPKTFLIECADYKDSVGVDKIQTDLRKLQAAREDLHEAVVLVHISRNGYSPEAAGYALKNSLSAMTYANLQSNLVNFGPYISAVESDRLRPIIMREYQPTTINLEGASNSDRRPALAFLEGWLSGASTYLILLGDYGVGKSWLLRRYLYDLLDKYKSDPANQPLPFFVPLQRFTKAFDFQNLVLKTFETYGLSGVHYAAFLHLVRTGRVIMLLDSFDEMAQHLTRTTIRENLAELFNFASHDAKFIMTSRPNYFENRAERILLVERYDRSNLHPLDQRSVNDQAKLSEFIGEQISNSSFGRLNDLTPQQRTRLFTIVLSEKPEALSTLTSLLQRFQALNHLSQRAVIARLLTTVAETLASEEPAETIDGEPLVPKDLEELNQARVFQIVLHNLLQRDQGIGSLSARDRLQFLKRFAVYLQRRGSDFFASPDEVRSIVKDTFSASLARTDAPEQELESYYRTCRRHSGLTTEGQFYDTSGVIDLPVSEYDLDSRIGFSHNSLREYLVSTSISDVLRVDDGNWASILSISLSDLIVDFLEEAAFYDKRILADLSRNYLEFAGPRQTDFLFELLSRLIKRDRTKNIRLLGTPPILRGVDLSGLSFEGLDLNESNIEDCLIQDTVFVGTSLVGSSFKKSIIERAKLNGANLKGADFSLSNVVSIEVFDDYDRKTYAVLEDKDAYQWIFSRGGKVPKPEAMNPLLGRPWYEAAREVTRTLERHRAGTHQKRSLAKGTPVANRRFADDFVDFLMDRGVLERVVKSRYGDGWVVKLRPEFYKDITDFSKEGSVSETLKPFFSKHLDN